MLMQYMDRFCLGIVSPTKIENSYIHAEYNINSPNNRFKAKVMQIND